MTTTSLEKESKILKNIIFDKEKFEKSFFLSEKNIKKRLDKIDEYYKTHEFVGTPVKEAYINGIKKLNFKYELMNL